MVNMSFESLVGTVGRLWIDYSKNTWKQVQDELVSHLSTKLSVAELDEFRKHCDTVVSNICEACVAQTPSDVPNIVPEKEDDDDDVGEDAVVSQSKSSSLYTKKELEALTVPSLKEILITMKLSKTGTKAILISRILENQKEDDEDEEEDDDVSISADNDDGEDEDDDDEDDDDDDDDDEEDEEDD